MLNRFIFPYLSRCAERFMAHLTTAVICSSPLMPKSHNASLLLFWQHTDVLQHLFVSCFFGVFFCVFLIIFSLYNGASVMFCCILPICVSVCVRSSNEGLSAMNQLVWTRRTIRAGLIPHFHRALQSSAARICLSHEMTKRRN